MKPILKLCAAVGFLLFLAGCDRNKKTYQSAGGGKLNSALTENFESAGKSGYSPAQIKLSTGNWYLSDALIAGTTKDARSGNQSVRIRNRGELRMDFDITGVAQVTIKHAAYQKNETARWQLKMSTDGGSSYQQVGPDITSKQHQLQTVSFSINQQKPVRFEIVKISGGNNRINIDDFTILPTGSGSTINTQNTATNVDHSAPVTGDNSNLLLGNPSNAVANVNVPDNYLMIKPYYTLSYNRSRGGPNWVCWYLGDEWLGSVKRVNDFRPDDSLPDGWYKVQSTSYVGSGFERGHNCPSADRTVSLKANSATFLMTNMIPQAPANNENTWGNLEGYERMLVNKGNEVYIIMGSYGQGGYGTQGKFTTIDNGHITVPSNVWKVIVVIPNGNNDLQRINASTRVIAVNTPNNNSISADWTKYICTVRDIEKTTGYNLLSKLPKDVQDAIETRKDSGISADDGYIIRY
ncbi:DNA/RNA non-specific endonuclease [Mucilaginibacter sp. CSA2-8R]|uniref:DNA/RNA non-specific endonuclease n=1 Tax=Mucilaginibacter sp. CSA2-8R TaxID=3141542 RepID=UPI00315D007D